MKIAYCSDLHLDFLFKEGSDIKRSLKHHFSKYFEELDSKTLIIAGDLTHHSPEYSVEVLLEMKYMFGLDNIITVNGNHCQYIVDKSSKQRFENGLQLGAFRTDLYNLNGIIALDGNVVDIDGIKIGGCDSFYDGSIYFRQTAGWYSSSGGIDAYWRRFMNDSKYMKLDDFMMHSKQEKDKLLKLKNQCDIMVTHVKPVIEERFIHPDFKGELSNCFYTFDWSEHVFTDSKLKYWVYGHTHNEEEYTFGGKSLVCNPRGYPKENPNAKIQHLEI